MFDVGPYKIAVEFTGILKKAKAIRTLSALKEVLSAVKEVLSAVNRLLTALEVVIQ